MKKEAYLDLYDSRDKDVAMVRGRNLRQRELGKKRG